MVTDWGNQAGTPLDPCIARIFPDFYVPRIFVLPEFSRIFVWPVKCEILRTRSVASADSRKLDKQRVLPKKEIRLLTNLRLFGPSSI